MRFSPSITLGLLSAALTLNSATASPRHQKRVDRSLESRASNWAHWGDKYRTGKVVRGVNLGAWASIPTEKERNDEHKRDKGADPLHLCSFPQFILESWMVPYLFLTPDLENQSIPDEWTFSKVVTAQSGKDELKSRLKKHWATWITEKDFAKMKSVGLNTVRIPVGMWAYTSSSSEPYQNVAQRPFIRAALGWAQKYGLDVVMDLHGLPNSQNGYDNSGHAGPIGFSESDIPRSIKALEYMVKNYVNDPAYGGVVKAIELANEPRIGNNAIPRSTLMSYNRQAYAAVRAAMDPKAVTRVTVFISDAFADTSATDAYDSLFGEFPSASMAVDWHYYEAFGDLAKLSNAEHIKSVCALGPKMAAESKKRPVVIGEWSIGTSINCTPVSDCKGKRMQQSVAEYNTASGNIFKRRFFEAQASTYEQNAGGWIMWNWKTTSVSDWSYEASVDQGWIPSNVSDESTWAFYPSTDPSSCISKASSPNQKLNFKTQRS